MVDWFLAGIWRGITGPVVNIKGFRSSTRFGFWPVWTRCCETLRGLLGCRSCDGGLVVPYRSHGLADQELHVLILQSCWATSTPETFSTISSVRRPKATLACGESDTSGLCGQVRVTWVGAMTPSSHWFTLCLLVSASSFLPSLLLCFALNLKTVCVHVSVCCCHREPTLERRGVSIEHFHGSVLFLIGAIWYCIVSPCHQCPRSPSSVHFECVRWILK